ncbi:hypothetical protein CsatB_012068 [Cannabis sativa]|uniref:RNase H type-1 domain-containing protein n=1 Tax=Cannabis sativa TaxID=3483 RepID=A0A803NZG3_CANSA
MIGLGLDLWRCQQRQLITVISSQNGFRFGLRSSSSSSKKKAEAVPVSWAKPEMGWAKLNFDGSSKGAAGNNKASIGGVIRNHKAEFLMGYAESIGEANSNIAELVALRRGLELVLEYGLWSHVWLEGDAKTLLDIIVEKRQVKCVDVQMHVAHINSIIPKLSSCIVSHIYREGNRAADKLARMGHYLDKPQVWCFDPPHEVVPLLFHDAEGKIVFRKR